MQVTRRSKTWRALLLLALTSAVGCGTDPGEENAAGGLLPAGTNLVLVTLDTTRADRIGSYGHAAARTPNIDGLARRGVRFERAYAHVPLTLPTHASLLTGTLPPEHGIHDNGRRALGEQLTTLAEVFRDKGYRTGAFVSAIALDSSFGLDRGFDVYDDDLASNAAGGGRVIHRAGDQTTERALEWLATGSAPFFLWVHYYDPHADYTPPAGFALEDPYDGEIAFVDAQVGRLLGWLESRDWLAQSLVVAIADHGESLGEKGEHTHASLIYDGTQRIPFVLSMPAALPAGLEVQAVVGQSDLYATLMELYDWAVPAEVSGRSLVPLLRGESLPASPVWLESEYAALNFGWSSLHGIVHEQWKYLQAPTPELYNLLEDPAELNNLATDEPGVAKRLAARLHELRTSMGSYGGQLANTSASLARDLSGLGYAQGSSGTTDAAGDSDINPIEHIDALEQYHAAIGFSNRGEFERMIAPLETVARAFPQAAGFRTQLGDTYRRVGRTDEARLELEAALKLDPNYDPAHFYLGELERMQGRTAQAIACYRKTLDLRPDYVPASERLGGLLAFQGQTAEALAIFEGLLEEDATDGEHWLALADLHGTLGHAQERLAAVERAAQLLPDDLGTQNLLAWLLATSAVESLRSGTRALELAQNCVDASQRTAPEPLLTLAAAQAELGQFEQALKTLREAIDLARESRAPEYVAQLRVHEQTLSAGAPLRQP